MGKRLAQFNIRMEQELLEKFKNFCRDNGLDPQLQVINYIRKMVETEYNFQEKIWEIMREGVIEKK